MRACEGRTAPLSDGSCARTRGSSAR
jgi:hypothetical protein